MISSKNDIFTKLFMVFAISLSLLNVVDFMAYKLLNIYVIKNIPYIATLLIFLYLCLFFHKILLTNYIQLVLFIFIFILIFILQVVTLPENISFYILNIKDKLVPYLIALFILLAINIEKSQKYFIYYFHKILLLFAIFQLISILNYYFDLFDLSEFYTYANKQDNLNEMTREFVNFLFPRVNGLSGNLHLSNMILLIGFAFSLFYSKIYLKVLLFIELFFSFSLQFVASELLIFFLYIILFMKKGLMKMVGLVLLFIVTLVVIYILILHIGSEYNFFSTFNTLQEYTFYHILGVGTLIGTFSAGEQPDYNNAMEVFNYVYIMDNRILEYLVSSGLYVFLYWLWLNTYIIFGLYKISKQNNYYKFLFFANIITFISYWHYIVILNKSITFIYAILIAHGIFYISFEKEQKIEKFNNSYSSL